MVKYGVQEVFDLAVYDENGLVFAIDTATKVRLEGNTGEGFNTLFIEDALMDSNIMNEVFSGKFDKKSLRLEGISTWRNPNDGSDVDVRLHINTCEIASYLTSFSHYKSSIMIGFEFPYRDSNGVINFSLDTY